MDENKVVLYSSNDNGKRLKLGEEWRLCNIYESWEMIHKLSSDKLISDKNYSYNS